MIKASQLKSTICTAYLVFGAFCAWFSGGGGKSQENCVKMYKKTGCWKGQNIQQQEKMGKQIKH